MHLASPDNLIPALQSVPSNLTTVIADSKIERLNVAAARRAFRHRPHTHVLAARRNLFVDHLHTLSRSHMLHRVPVSPVADNRDAPLSTGALRRDPWVGAHRTYVPPTTVTQTSARARFLEYLYLNRPAEWPYDAPADGDQVRGPDAPYLPHRIPSKGPYGPRDLNSGPRTDVETLIDTYL